MCMYPEADIPVLQVSLPGEDPARLLALGQALVPLRDEGVLIAGSGFLTHNMRAFSNATPAWATAFDQWAARTLAGGDIEALCDYRARAPNVATALPTREHFTPLIVAAGAARGDSAKFPIEGFAFGSFTKRSVQWG